MVKKMTPDDSDMEVMIKYDREGKIQKIIEATFNLILKKDFEKITIRQIAEEAGVSIGTVYLYFPAGKVDIIKNLVGYARSSIPSDELSIKKEAPDLNSALKKWLNKFLRFHQENRSLLLAFEKASLRRPEIFQDVNIAADIEALKAPTPWVYIPEINETMKRLDFTIEEMRDSMRQAVHIIDALVHRHVLFSRLYKEDNQLIEVLIRIFRELVLK